MIKKLFIIGISLGMAGAIVRGMQGPSSSAASSSLSEEQDALSSRERTIREKPVKKMKASLREKSVKKMKTSLVPIVEELNPRAEMLIERAAASQNDIDNFFLDLTERQIRVLNKIIFYHQLDEPAHLFSPDKEIFDAFPKFIKRLFHDTQEQESEQESNRGY